MALISVVIPTRNREMFLKDAVASVLQQSEKSLEVIVVNDGDHALPEQTDARVRVVDNGRRGHVPARNTGISHASGSVIAFLDDDDVWLDRDHLARSLSLMDDGADLTFADGDLLFPDGARRVFAEDATAQSLERDNTILVSGVCYRRALHERIGSFDEALPYYWDWDWYLRVARSGGRILRDPHRAIGIRIHASNMSGEISMEARRDNLGSFARKHGLGALVLKTHSDFTR